MTQKSIQDVENFWNNNPLFVGESEFNPGSQEYFVKHTQVYVDDCFAGRFDSAVISYPLIGKHVLDLGCGPGFWIEQIAKHFPKTIVAADLTDNALELSKRRSEMIGITNVSYAKANAEDLCFEVATFDHVNCQGVIHHTPDTEKAFKEISRVLKRGGSFSVSVYYKNIFLRPWPVLRFGGKLLNNVGGGLKGRGRENIYLQNNADDIVRLYDGSENPIGKSYSKQQLQEIIPQDLKAEKFFLHFFPARSLPFPLPSFLHSWLDRNIGFMIYVVGTKRNVQ
jgi:ubiquinone/menaquinone biosynthesis C-methylase UbiE